MSTPSVRFRLRKETKSSSYLQCFISIYGQEAPKFSSNISITDSIWNQKTQKFEDSANKNSILAEMIATVDECFIMMRRANKFITAISLKKEFLKVWKIDIKPITLLQIYSDYLNDVDENRNLEEKTIGKYYQTQIHLKNYLKTLRRNDLEFNELDPRFGFNFFKWLKTFVSEPTAKRYLQYVKASLDFAFENGVIDNNPFLNVNPRVKHPRANKTMITENQLLEIHNLEEMTRTERQVADIAIFMFYTTLDYCDYAHFSFSEHIKEINGTEVVEKIRYKMRKTDTDEMVTIPINKILKEVFDKYKTHFPIYPDATVRRVFKILCSRIGVVNFNKIGLKQIRKSGGTYYLNNDVPLKTVSAKILGHSSVAMTEKHYVKIEEKTVIRHTRHLRD